MSEEADKCGLMRKTDERARVAPATGSPNEKPNRKHPQKGVD